MHVDEFIFQIIEADWRIYTSVKYSRIGPDTEAVLEYH